MRYQKAIDPSKLNFIGLPLNTTTCLDIFQAFSLFPHGMHTTRQEDSQ